MESSKSPKPRICIALPGTDYVSHAPLLFANTLPMVPHLQKWFDVTLLFRQVVGNPELEYSYISILESAPLPSAQSQPTANFSPTGFFSAWRYLRQFKRLPKTYFQSFDLVIERQWSLVGSLTQVARRQGAAALMVLEAEFYDTRQPYFGWAKYPRKQLSTTLFKQLLPQFRQRWIKAASGLIVETEQMATFVRQQQMAPEDKTIYAIANGINPDIFFPRDRNDCRRTLGLNTDTVIITYLGSLNGFIQSPGAMIEALGRSQPVNVELHIIGDGLKRQEFETIAQRYQAKAIFHGRQSQRDAALYIGAANLCVAPYDKSLFPKGEFTSASLKVCEYLACGRPVMTIPAARMDHLLQKGAYGFYIDNSLESFQTFFQAMPSPATVLSKENILCQHLQDGTLKQKDIVVTWQDIAEQYKKVILTTLQKP